jgi:hypothetical protein
MFLMAVCLSYVGGVLADDPIAAVQRRYPVHRLAVTSTSGTIVHYTLPAGAPTELRLAYKLLEVTEREFLTSEALQLLELEFVQNERKLEALQFGYAAWYLRSPNTQGPGMSRFTPVRVPESAYKRALARNFDRGVTAERAVTALYNLARAQSYLRQVLEALAYPGRPMPGPPDGVASRPRPADPDGAQLLRVAAQTALPAAPPAFPAALSYQPRGTAGAVPAQASQRPLAAPLTASRLNVRGPSR